MGKLVQGVWHDVWYDTESNDGKFIREDAGFRHWLTPDGQPGPEGKQGFQAESGRYHLYVSLACPWAHRTLVMRQLKGLVPHIDVTVVSPDMLEKGWAFEQPEPLYGLDFLHQLYTKAKPDYTGRVTVPVLWDKQTETIVSNESSEIMGMFNTAFNGITGNTDDYYPAALQDDIEQWNALIYPAINNGVYRCGFATTQAAYEEAYESLFAALDRVNAHLATHRFLTGDQITEADWRLFTTLVRFDAVYVGHFKCNKRRIADYPHLQDYLKALYQQPGIADTVDIAHIKRHYYFSHATINPTRIVPVGPDLDFTSAHSRG
ncbi:glutathione S-transferase family protein [Photobacterium aphoticum]|uniref:Glutathionyl-hydroquinone reductase YqjG n=1 Tax=Photobacterium aphoticum TaxID=754436 RepID=A0A0J1GI22_9GAMM|nr:glutathione S-transferase family protein [Photobacterium aphoticum]KLU99352.1 glutathionyl-hydroquinone reductase YqjG [Photobacterium aphoticum]PSU55485.1 glutathione S-transferase family protein [Photobacterium aphoticum]GHA63894.1 glutathione-dependent reductase [Photobacterium aphoticum]